MNTALILQGKQAVVFGAGGSIGAAVSKEFATEGAEVFLSGRTRSNVEEVSKENTSAGGRAHVAVIDALDDVAVNEYIEGVAKQAGRIDIVIGVSYRSVSVSINSRPNSSVTSPSPRRHPSPGPGIPSPRPEQWPG